MSGLLDRRGRWLADAQGRIVFLHGVNVVNKLPPYHPAAIGFDDSHAAFLAQQGFNTVRLGMIWKALEPQPGRYDDHYIDEIAATAALLGDRGLHVLVDFHQDMCNERFNGEGFPDWAVRDDGIRPWPDLGFPANYFVMRALWRAYDHFWSNSPGPGGVGLQDRYAAAWRHVAGRLTDVSAIFGYDIFNEPFPGSVAALCAFPGGYEKFDRKLSSFSRKVFEAIREVDSGRLLFYEPNVLFNTGSRTHHDALGDERAGMSFHNYCFAATPGMPRLRGPLKGRVCTMAEQRVFDNAIWHAERAGVTLMLSEFGASDDLETIARMCDHCDRNMISWQYWSYWNRDPCCARPEEGLVHDLAIGPGPANVKLDKLATLSRPFPRAVAGRPLRFGFDRETSVFEVSYAPQPDAGSTEVVVPPQHYPRGYRVEARGAIVSSNPGAAMLELQADPAVSGPASIRLLPP